MTGANNVQNRIKKISAFIYIVCFHVAKLVKWDSNYRKQEQRVSQYRFYGYVIINNIEVGNLYRSLPGQRLIC